MSFQLLIVANRGMAPLGNCCRSTSRGIQLQVSANMTIGAIHTSATLPLLSRTIQWTFQHLLSFVHKLWAVHIYHEDTQIKGKGKKLKYIFNTYWTKVSLTHLDTFKKKKSLLENWEHAEGLNVSLSHYCGNTQVLQCVSQLILRLGFVSNHKFGVVTRPRRPGKAWSLAGFCIVTLLSLSLFSWTLESLSTPPPPDPLIHTLVLFFSLYLLHNWNCFCGPISQTKRWRLTGWLEMSCVNSYIKCKCQMYKILDIVFFFQISLRSPI